jgi:hypothetical protein
MATTTRRAKDPRRAEIDATAGEIEAAVENMGSRYEDHARTECHERPRRAELVTDC